MNSVHKCWSDVWSCAAREHLIQPLRFTLIPLLVMFAV